MSGIPGYVLLIYTTKVAVTIVKLKERSNISVKPKYKKKKKNMIQKL